MAIFSPAWEMPEIDSLKRAEHSPRYGLAFAALTTVLWGAEPVVFRVLLQSHSPTFITWIRFSCALPLLLLVASRKNALRKCIPPPAIALLGGVFLSLNYIGFMQGVALSGPTQAAILIQSGTVFFSLAGVILFRERLSAQMMLGIVIAVVGYWTYFIARTANSAGFGTGDWIVICAALSWALYASCQKKLSADFHPLTLTSIIFTVAALCFTPFVDFHELFTVTPRNTGLLALVVISTFTAYYSFGEAIRYAPSVQVSALISLNPLVTLALVAILAAAGLAPHDELTRNAMLGIALSLCGILLVVLARQEPRR